MCIHVIYVYIYIEHPTPRLLYSLLTDEPTYPIHIHRKNMYAFMHAFYNYLELGVRLIILFDFLTLTTCSSPSGQRKSRFEVPMLIGMKDEQQTANEAARRSSLLRSTRDTASLTKWVQYEVVV